MMSRADVFSLAAKAVATTTVLVALLAACSTIPKPTIDSFKASPTSVVEGSGTAVTLTWKTSDAASWGLSDGSNTIAIAQSATGSVDVTPAATTTYTLTAANSTGVAKDTVQVTVTPAGSNPTITSFTATPNPVASGGTVTLAWDTSNAVSWSLNDGSSDIPIDQNAAGFVQVSVSATTTYTLTASNTAGDTTDTVQVFIKPGVTGLTATIAMGSTVDVSWSATDATSFDLYAVLTSDTTDQQLIQAGVTSPVNVPIPTSDRQILRVVANGAGGSQESADVALQDVVVSTADYDPYDLQGVTPEPPIPGTLRYVLDDAQPGAIIGFAADITSIELPGVDIEDVNNVKVDSHLILRKDVTISAPATGVTLTGTSGAPAGTPPDEALTWESRVLFVMAGVTATIDHLTIEGGRFIYAGAGIRNEGDLTIDHSTITDNRAWYEGGGIWNGDGANLTVNDSHIDGNLAVVLDGERNRDFVIRGIDPRIPIHVVDGGYGAGIFNLAGATATVDSTTFDGNEAKYSGGGIYNEGGVMGLTASPVTNNSADYSGYAHDPSTYSWGGGAYTDGTFSFSNADFVGNTSANVGGGFAFDDDGLVTATLDTVHFDGNHADFGGGWYQQYCTDPSHLVLIAVTYGVNTADSAGPDSIADDVCPVGPVVAPLAVPAAPAKPFPDPATLR